MTATTTKARSHLAAERSHARRKGLVYLGSGDSRPVSDVLAYVAESRARLDDLEAEAVYVGRETGLSWDRLSFLLGGRPSGEGLRRRYPSL